MPGDSAQDARRPGRLDGMQMQMHSIEQVKGITCGWVSQCRVTPSCFDSASFLQLQQCISALKAIFGLIFDQAYSLHSENSGSMTNKQF